MKKRHTPEQIVRMLREAHAELAAGASVPEVARKLGVSEATFHRWRNQYGGMKADATKRLKELEKENARLKKIVAEQAVDISILKEVSRKNFEPDPEEGCRRARSAAPWGLRASGVRGDRPAQVHPALRGPSEGRVGPRSGRAHGRALTGEPALWLQAGVGAAQTGMVVGEQEAGTPVVEGGGP